METSSEKHSDSTSLPPVEVRRGAFAQLTIDEVAECELDILAHGTPDSLYLNFAIFLLSVGISFLIGLLTALLSTRVFTIFVIITTVGFVIGFLLLVIWLKKRSSISDLVGKIRSRLPTEGVQELN